MEKEENQVQFPFLLGYNAALKSKNITRVSMVCSKYVLIGT